MSDSHRLIKRQKAVLYKRQKAFVDGFESNEKPLTFVVRELLANATDAIRRQGEGAQGEVEVTVDACGETVLLTVKDNGVGIADFSKEIMAEAASTSGAACTGGKGSAKECFGVQGCFWVETSTGKGAMCRGGLRLQRRASG